MFLKSIDLFAKNWSKREQAELKYLSEWKDQLKELVADRISNLKGHFKSPKYKVLNQPDVKDTLHKLHANYVLVPADKTANNVIIVCKKYYINTLFKEFRINSVNSNNPTYIPIDDSFETIVKSHNNFTTSVGLEMSEDGLVRYCNTKTSHNGVNNKWILKNSTSLLSSLDQLDVRTATSVQAFDFSTLYTSIEKANKSGHLADYLDFTFIIGSGGKLSTRLHDKCDDFDFHIVNFPFLQQHTIWPFIWCIHFAAHKICKMLLTLQ